MKQGIGIVAVVLLLAVAAVAGSEELRPSSSFSSIADKSERSAALFTEAGKVLLHPRCVNCHPAGESPSIGDDGRDHEPWVQRGKGGRGVAGMRCSTCHQDANFDPAQLPGAPHWHLAPLSMAWQGKSLAEICAQIKDRALNGNRSLKEITKHMTDDPLVGWAWAPGTGREPAPGDQTTFAKLIRDWVATGAVCPSDGGAQGP